MSETRRQLFKTSVMSAFGLMAGSAIAHATCALPEYIIVRATADPAGHTQLPLFVQTDAECFVQAFAISPINPILHPLPPSGHNFDVRNEILKGKHYNLTPFSDTFYVNGNPVSISDGAVTDSAGALGNLTSMSWNEIGAQRHVKHR